MRRAGTRTAAGWLICLLGAALALLGLTLMVMLGPDNRVTTGPHAVETNGSVVVTAPRVITWSGAQLDVLAEVPASKPVFVGLGNTVDVQSLVGGTSRLEVTKFSRPWDPTYRTVQGRATVQGAPTALDWWKKKSAGLGGASISTTLPDEPVSLAIVSVGASNLSGLEVTLAYGIKGGFMKGLGLLLAGLGTIGAGLAVRRAPQDDAEEPVAEDEEVVYLVVDEQGVERELTAAEVEAGGFEVLDDPAPEPESEPEPEPEPEPAPAPVEQSEPDAPVVYVYVDDDGVEHEIGEDELAEFEVIDESDPQDPPQESR